MLYVLVAVGETFELPETAAPVMKSLLVHEVASVELQVKLEVSPATIEILLALKLTAGSLPTVSALHCAVTFWCELPPLMPVIAYQPRYMGSKSLCTKSRVPFPE